MLTAGYKALFLTCKKSSSFGRFSRIPYWHARCKEDVRRESNASRKFDNRDALMKAMKKKELLSLVGIAIAAPVFALTLVAGAHAAAVAANDVLLLALALCGAVHGGLNGFGRRTLRAEVRSVSQPSVRQARAVTQS
jgi:hypothetical protein